MSETSSMSLFSKLLQKDQELAEIRGTVKDLQEEKKSLEFLLVKSSEEIRRLTESISTLQQSQLQLQQNQVIPCTPVPIATPSNEQELSQLQHAIWNAYSVIQHLTNEIEISSKKVSQFKQKLKKSKDETKECKKELIERDDRILKLTQESSVNSAKFQQEAERVEKQLNERITAQEKQIEQLQSKLEGKDQDITKQLDELEKISADFKVKESLQSKQIVFLRIENLKLKTAAESAAITAEAQKQISNKNGKQYNNINNNAQQQEQQQPITVNEIAFQSSSRNTSLTPQQQLQQTALHDTIPKYSSNHSNNNHQSHSGHLLNYNQMLNCYQSQNSISTIQQQQIHQSGSSQLQLQHQQHPRISQQQQGYTCGCPYSTIDADSNDTLVRSISSCSGRMMHSSIQQQQQQQQNNIHRGGSSSSSELLNNTIDIVGERARNVVSSGRGISASHRRGSSCCSEQQMQQQKQSQILQLNALLSSSNQQQQSWQLSSSKAWLLEEIDRVTSYSLREIPRNLAELADRILLMSANKICDSECLSEIIRRIAILVGGFMSNSYLSDSHATAATGIAAGTGTSASAILANATASAIAIGGSSQNSMNMSEILSRKGNEKDSRDNKHYELKQILAELNSSVEDATATSKQQKQQNQQQRLIPRNHAKLPPQGQMQVYAQTQVLMRKGEEREIDEMHPEIVSLKMQLQKKYSLKVKELEAVLVWIAAQLNCEDEQSKMNDSSFKSANRFASLLPGLCSSNPNLKPFLDDVLTRIKVLKERNSFLVKEHTKMQLSHTYVKSLR